MNLPNEIQAERRRRRESMTLDEIQELQAFGIYDDKEEDY